MNPSTDRALRAFSPRRAVGAIAIALMLCSLGLTGCGVISKVKAAVHTAEGNKATMDAFTNKVKAGEAVPFEATYVTTGSSPATIVYAVQPPKDLNFTDTPSVSATTGSASDNVDIVVNPSGEYLCTPPSASNGGSSSTWTCEKLPKSSASEENDIIDFYTPSHWVTFLDDFALAAGFAGDKVTDSSLSVNGFAMSCVDFVAPGVAGKSTICTTSQNILGYVKVAGDSTSFEIKSYTPSPSSSLFELPAGATITTLPANTIPTTTS
jgi:hypothetical protein